jgi:hypothetical protein
MKGGLGEQLFQLAAGLTIVKSNLNKLVLDLSYFSDLGRNMANDSFLIPKLLGFERLNLIDSGYSPVYGKRISIDETPDYYHPDLVNSGEYNWFSGYFMNTKYLMPSINYIRQHYRKTANGTRGWRSVGITEAMENLYRCGAYFRRGVYSSEGNPRTHGVCKQSALIKVMDYIVSIGESTTPSGLASRLCFSDDLLLDCKPNYSQKLRNLFVVNEDRMLAEFYLMSTCHSLICSNSTFSYWAGLLSLVEKTRIYLPNRWMISERMKTDSLLHPSSELYDVEFEI